MELHLVLINTGSLRLPPTSRRPPTALAKLACLRRNAAGRALSLPQLRGGVSFACGYQSLICLLPLHYQSPVASYNRE